MQRLCKAYLDFCAGDNNTDMWTNGEGDLITKTLPSATTVFDIGANVGDWASLALSVNPRIVLHCFEPSPTTFKSLASRQFPSGVTLNNCGLSSSAGDAPLYVFGDCAGVNSLYRRAGLEDGWNLASPSSHESVRLETFDSYCAAHGIQCVDFCKVDVEGHELEVFKGMAVTFSSHAVKMVQFEYGGCNIDSRVFLKDIFEYLSSFDYRLYKMTRHAPRLVTRYDQRLETFQYQNWLAVAPGLTLPASMA